MIIDTEQLREKLNEELRKWDADFRPNSAYMLSLLDLYSLEIIENRFIKYFGDSNA